MTPLEEKIEAFKKKFGVCIKRVLIEPSTVSKQYVIPEEQEDWLSSFGKEMYEAGRREAEKEQREWLSPNKYDSEEGKVVRKFLDVFWNKD